jgi:hypothetical protein
VECKSMSDTAENLSMVIIELTTWFGNVEIIVYCGLFHSKRCPLSLSLETPLNLFK